MTKSTTYTEENLANLEAAIAEGALKVKYADKEIEYRSLKDMLKIVDIMKKALGKDCPAPAGRKGLFGGRRINAEYDKDL
tara:strand:+ start:2667 stop:2906 length:240 start_codon:yes stop_codon:yes gene_type:complete